MPPPPRSVVVHHAGRDDAGQPAELGQHAIESLEALCLADPTRKLISSVATCSATSPVSVATRRSNERSMSPAPTSMTPASANSAPSEQGRGRAAHHRRSHRARLSLDRGGADPRVAPNAGHSPNRIPVMTASSVANASTRRSSCTGRRPPIAPASACEGPGERRRRRRCRRRHRTPRALRFPARSCRTRRRRVAPRTVRTASSRDRDTPYEIGRFVTFAQAIGRSSAVVAKSTRSAVRRLPTSSARSGVNAPWARMTSSVSSRSDVAPFAGRRGYDSFPRAAQPCLGDLWRYAGCRARDDCRRQIAAKRLERRVRDRDAHWDPEVALVGNENPRGITWMAS